MAARRQRLTLRRAVAPLFVAEGLERRVLLSAAYTIIDLTPASGDTSSSATAIDATGDVVGGSEDSSGNTTATVWLAGQGPTALPGQGAILNAVNSVNGTGVGAAENLALGAKEAALWTLTSGPTPLGILRGDVKSTAVGVNDYNDVVGISVDSSNDTHAFVWTAGTGIEPLDFSQLGGYLNTVATGTNDAGEITGDAQFSSSQSFEAFRFSNSSGAQFDVIPGGSYSYGTAINSAGDVVGDGNAAGTQIANEAFIWPASNPNPQGIGSFQSSPVTIPTGINAADQIVGYGGNNDGSNASAFVWSAGTYHSLISQIPSGSGWTALTDASGINDAGQIVGFGTINGQTHAFLMTPAASSATAPTGTITAQDVTVSGVAQETVTVSYQDGSASIDTSSIDPSDISVAGPNGALSVTGVTVSGSGSSVIATYAVAAPSGTFSSTDNGTYDITLNANTVTDNNGAANPGATSTFNVNVPFSSSDALSASVFASDVNTLGSTTSTAYVLYVDTVAAIDVSTISGSNLTVSGPGGAATVTSDEEAPIANGRGVLARYFITAPGGAWTPADVGTYTVSLGGGAVKDIDGNPVQATGTTFSVNDVEDVNFGSQPMSGSAATGSINLTFQAQDLVIEPTGEILLVGSQSASFGSSQGVLEQLSSDGTVDTTFNGSGSVSTPASMNVQFFGAAVAGNGDIVAAGTSNGAFFVARYLPSGLLDTSFGSSGYATVAFTGGSAIAYNVSVAGDGSIVLSGAAGSVFALARLTAQGALDPNFNAGGVDDSTYPHGGQMTLSTGGSGVIASATLQGDGKIIGVGSSGTSVVVLRLNPDGSRDATFATNGLLTVSQLTSQDSDGTVEGQGIALTAGGNILVCGEPTGGGLAAVRITPTGTIDTTFGNAGISVAKFGGARENADEVLVNPNTGEYVLIGTTNAGNVNQLAVAAFNPDGTPDTSFGTSGNGQVSLPAPGASSGATTRAFHPQLSDFAIASFQNGNVVVAGSGNMASVVRRIQSPGIVTAPTTMVGRVGRKNYKLAPITLADGTIVTITVTGGGGTVSTLGNQIALTLSGSPNVMIKTRGGSGALTLSNVTITGNLSGFTAPTATLAGTLLVSGRTGKITLGKISGVVRGAGAIANISANSDSGSISAGAALGAVKLGNVTGTVAAGGNISSFTAISLAGATILAGTNLGAAGMIGSGNAYGLGDILNFKVLGSVATSFIGAGVNPVDLIFGNGNDTLAAAKSKIGPLLIKGGIDASSLIESGAFPKFANIPGRISTATDAHFKRLT